MVSFLSQSLFVLLDFVPLLCVHFSIRVFLPANDQILTNGEEHGTGELDMHGNVTKKFKIIQIRLKKK